MMRQVSASKSGGGTTLEPSRDLKGCGSFHGNSGGCGAGSTSAAGAAAGSGLGSAGFCPHAADSNIKTDNDNPDELLSPPGFDGLRVSASIT
jgi:hypothetical protein